MSAPCFDRFDLPKRLVRPLRNGERIPFYSTAELLLGVCHLPLAPATNALARMRTGAIKGASQRTERARVILERVRPQIKDRLAAGDRNIDIAEHVNITKSQLTRFLRTDTELREASAKRPRHMHWIR